MSWTGILSGSMPAIIFSVHPELALFRNLPPASGQVSVNPPEGDKSAGLVVRRVYNRHMAQGAGRKAHGKNQDHSVNEYNSGQHMNGA